MKRTPRFFVLIALAGFLFGLPARAEADPSLRTALRHDLAQYLAARGKAEHISAASVSVRLPGSGATIDAAAGTTAINGGVPVTPQRLFQIGSNTKAFTAVALLQLESEGKLTIDQTVGRWLPQYPAWRNVTIRRLLNMTSGIPSYDTQGTMMRAWAKEPNRVFSARELIAFVYPSTRHAPKPTTGWSYSNTNYLLAQLIVERATGRPFHDVIRRRFLDDRRLGLRDTFYSPAAYPHAVVDRMVSGYFFNNDPDNADLAPLYRTDVRDLNMSWAQGAGGIVSRPQDLTRWARALYVGPLLAPSQRREMMALVSDVSGKPIAETTPRDKRGFGLAVGQVLLPSLGRVWYYEGETLGYRALYGWFPEYDTVIAIALNSQPPGKQDRIGQLMTTVYRTLKAHGALTPVNAASPRHRARSNVRARGSPSRALPARPRCACWSCG